MSADSSAAQSSPVERERAMLLDAESKGGGAKLSVWVKLSGPGWLQSAITLGGGSLAGSLFLGMVGGYSLLWLQVVAMLFGVVMLGAIGYVTLSTGERPFGLINKHVNPVLGWAWALATLAANIVWCLPQFSLANAAVQQNLAPSLEGQTAIICGVILCIAVGITMIYDSGGKGLKIYENSLRVLVALIGSRCTRTWTSSIAAGGGTVHHSLTSIERLRQRMSIRSSSTHSPETIMFTSVDASSVASRRTP